MQKICALVTLMKHMARHIYGFDVVMQRNVEVGMLLKFCLGMELCVSNTSFKRGGRKVTFRMGENEAEIDIVLIRKEHRWCLRNMKVIPG